MQIQLPKDLELNFSSVIDGEGDTAETSIIDVEDATWVGNRRTFVLAPNEAVGAHFRSYGIDSTKQKLFDATVNAKVWTSRVAMHLDRQTRDRFFSQLDRLHALEDWYGDDEPLKLGSYKTFVRAILLFNANSKPALALMPNGNLMALWENDGEKLTIEFKENDVARWLVSRPDGDFTERAAGQTKLKNLVSRLEPYNADSWFRGS